MIDQIHICGSYTYRESTVSGLSKFTCFSWTQPTDAFSLSLESGDSDQLGLPSDFVPDGNKARGVEPLPSKF